MPQETRSRGVALPSYNEPQKRDAPYLVRNPIKWRFYGAGGFDKPLYAEAVGQAKIVQGLLCKTKERRVGRCYLLKLVEEVEVHKDRVVETVGEHIQREEDQGCVNAAGRSGRIVPHAADDLIRKRLRGSNGGPSSRHPWVEHHSQNQKYDDSDRCAPDNVVTTIAFQFAPMKR